MTAPYAELIDAGWFADEAEEICAYARDTGLDVADVEGLAELCLSANSAVSYRTLALYHLRWPVSA